MATPVITPLTLEQKVLQSIMIEAKAASDVAAVWGHQTVSNLVAEVPLLAPAMVGFLDAIIAATKHPALSTTTA
jgi:hypothetical protein